MHCVAENEVFLLQERTKWSQRTGDKRKLCELVTNGVYLLGIYVKIPVLVFMK